MPRATPKFVWAGVVVFSILASCSDSADPPRPPERRTQEFSQEDKIAARLLSISSTEPLKAAGGAYAQALLCKRSMQVITALLKNSALTEEQTQAIRSATIFYDRRVASLGEKEGKSQGDIHRDLEQEGSVSRVDSARAQIALACLRNMMQSN